LVERKEAIREFTEEQTEERLSTEEGTALLVPLLVPFEYGFSISGYSETGIAIE
jgi:hypothetical protein